MLYRTRFVEGSSNRFLLFSNSLFDRDEYEIIVLDLCIPS